MYGKRIEPRARLACLLLPGLALFAASPPEKVELVNGTLAEVGDADATGAVQTWKSCKDTESEACWETTCSGVLVAPNAILSAAHCFRYCDKARPCRFFLQGFGAVEIDKCHANYSEPNAIPCKQEPKDPSLEKDLAFATLKESIAGINPVDLPPYGWHLGEDEKVRASGFGRGSDDISGDSGQRRKGLRQYFDTPVYQCGNAHTALCLGNPDLLRYSWGDSGGPLVRKEPSYLIGIAARRPGGAIRISGATLSWAHERLKELSGTADLENERTIGCALCPGNDKWMNIKKEAIPYFRYELTEGQRITTTINARLGVGNRTVDIALVRPGEKPRLCKAEEEHGLQDVVEVSLTSGGSFDVWAQACYENTLAQIIHSVTSHQ